MIRSEGIAEQVTPQVTGPRPPATMPLGRAVVLIGGICLLTVAFGLAVGYRFFWHKSTAPTRVQINLEEAKYMVKLNPKDANAWVDLGYAYFEAGDPAEARKNYRRALDLAPRNVWIHYFLGLVDFETKDYRQAETAFRQVAEAYPDNPLAFYMLGRTYYELGRYDQALAQADVISNRIDRTLADAYELRGLVFEKKGRKTRAIEEYKQALRLDPARDEARQGLRRLGVAERDIPAPPDGSPHRG